MQNRQEKKLFGGFYPKTSSACTSKLAVHNTWRYSLPLLTTQQEASLPFHRITQNDRMVGVGRDLCGSSSPTPCRSRVTQSRLHRTLSRRVLSISREGDSTTSLGSLRQGSVTLRVKKFFLMFRRNFLCFSSCPLPLVLSLGTTEKSLAPSS